MRNAVVVVWDGGRLELEQVREPGTGRGTGAAVCGREPPDVASLGRSGGRRRSVRGRPYAFCELSFRVATSLEAPSWRIFAAGRAISKGEPIGWRRSFPAHPGNRMREPKAVTGTR